MEKKSLTIATRASKLAIWQTDHIKDRIERKFPDIKIRIKEITSKGDRILDKPLALIGGKGHFTKELEDAILSGEADMAVHSLKDVPSYIPKGLELSAITKREDQSDIFLSHKFKSLEDLPKGSIVGTTSLRRRMQLLRIRPDLKMKDLRGNVNTRLKKLSMGEYDAIILAYIGLHRLNLLREVPFTQKLPLDLMIPPMGQASLGIEIISSDNRVRNITDFLNDKETFLLTKLERDFIKTINAGCSAPVAVNATNQNGKIKIKSMIGYPDGTNILEKSIEEKENNAQNLGFLLAKKMIDEGALNILKNAETISFKKERPERF